MCSYLSISSIHNKNQWKTSNQGSSFNDTRKQPHLASDSPPPCSQIRTKYSSRTNVSNRSSTVIQSDGHIVKDSTSVLDSKASKRETFRLASYNMCKIAVSPYLLAMAGFYHVGPGDRSRCFSCGNCVESWKMSDNVESDAWHRPDCKHMLQQDSGNVKLGDPPPEEPHSSSSKKTRTKSPLPPPAASQAIPPAQTPPRSSLEPNLSAIPSSSYAFEAPVMLSTVLYPEHQTLLEGLSLYREQDRRKTFTAYWPIHLSNLVDALSQSGFFFLGNLDRTQCFSCGAVLKDWLPEDNIVIIHAQYFPACRMVQQREPRNVPMPRTQRYRLNVENVHQYSLPANLGEQPSTSQQATSRMQHLARPGASYTPELHVERSIGDRGQSIPRYSPTPPFLPPNRDTASPFGGSLRTAVANFPSLNLEHVQSTSGIDTRSLTPTGQGAERYPSLNLELLQSTSSVNTRSLSPSASGMGNRPSLLHLQRPSRVDTRSLSPSGSGVEQRRQSPSSPARYPPIVQQPTSLIEEPFPQSSETVVMQPVPSRSELPIAYPPNESTHQPSTSRSLLVELDPFAAVSHRPQAPRLPQSELDVGNYLDEAVKIVMQSTYLCEDPAYPPMVYFGQRLSSFRAPWPEHESQSSITEAAEAGFYYLGMLDHVRCWYCGIKVEDWATKLTAWEVHARLYPTCQYLLRNRGADFVEAVLSQVGEENRASAERQRREPEQELAAIQWQGGVYPRVESGPERLPSPPPPLTAAQEAEEKKLELRRSMDSDLVLEALSMGFSRRHVRKVVKRQIQQWSCNYQTLEALVDELTTSDPDLIDLDSSDEEEAPAPSRSVGRGVSFEELDEAVELYRSEERPITNPTEDVEGNTNSPQRTPGHSRAPPTAGESRTSRMGNINEIRSKLVELRNEQRCKVCLDRQACIVFTPCGHMCACEQCAASLRYCPICRTQIRQAIKTYRP